jgi:uncharacterized protein (DUF2141 family)
MKRVLTTVVLGLLFTINFGFKPSEKSTLTIEVKGFENKATTKIWVSVFSKKDFLKNSLQTKSVEVSGNKVSVNFELPPGEYAVSTYHDENANNKLDRNFFGKPKEPYGFSNNATGFMGPPKYKDCKITVTAATETISINLTN